MTRIFENLGQSTRELIASLGRHSIFAASVLRAFATPPFRLQRILDEIYQTGVLSIVIICVSGGAVGMVLGLQGYNTLVRFGSEESLGALVGLSLVRELGPVLTALLVTGRAGSSATAEIGTMVVTEQLDGLRMLSIDPIHFIVTPKAVALALVMPLLSAMFILSALFGGAFAGSTMLGIDTGTYLTSLESAVDFRTDVFCSLVKALIFGVFLGLIATYRGYTCEPSSAGVSRATTQTVVIASVGVLILDHIITSLWGV